MGKFWGILLAVFLFPFFALAQNTENQGLGINLDGEARFVITMPDGNQYGSTKSEILDLNSPYKELFRADGQSIFINPLDLGQYSMKIDSYYHRPAEIDFELWSADGVATRSFDYVFVPESNNIFSFSVTDEGIEFSDSFFSPTNFQIQKIDRKTNLIWDSRTETNFYSIYYLPDLFPFYRLLATTTSTFLETGHDWSDYSDDPDFPDNLFSYHVIAHNIDGSHSVMSQSVSNNDQDSDGIIDIDEAAAGTDPNNADSDNDGLSDFYEKNRTHTDPLVSDTDGDGYSDGEEDIVQTVGIDAASTPPEPEGTCEAPAEGDWFVTTWCSITENQFVDENLVLLRGAYLVVRENVSIFVDFVNHHVLMKPGSHIEIEDGAKVRQAE